LEFCRSHQIAPSTFRAWPRTDQIEMLALDALERTEKADAQVRAAQLCPRGHPPDDFADPDNPDMPLAEPKFKLEQWECHGCREEARVRAAQKQAADAAKEHGGFDDDSEFTHLRWVPRPPTPKPDL